MPTPYLEAGGTEIDARDAAIVVVVCRLTIYPTATALTMSSLPA